MTNMAMYSAEFFGTLILILLRRWSSGKHFIEKSKGEGAVG